MECSYRVTNSISHIMGKAPCRARVRWRFNDGTLTCQKHEKNHRAKLHWHALKQLEVILERLDRAPKNEIAKRVGSIIKEGQCAPV